MSVRDGYIEPISVVKHQGPFRILLTSDVYLSGNFTMPQDYLKGSFGSNEKNVSDLKKKKSYQNSK